MIKLVVTAFETKAQAAGFAKKLLSRKLAACCTLLPGAVSFYEWKGKKTQSAEILLLIKTTASKLKGVEDFFKAKHPYDLPELLAVDAAASAGFGAWVKKQMD